MRKTMMLATALALLAGPALAGSKSPQTQSNTPDPARSSATGQPGNMDAGQGSPNLATVPDRSADSPNGQRLTRQPPSAKGHATTVPDRSPDSPNGQRLNTSPRGD